tara:strand:- start:2695 stop:3051 length:357 start_codon:yes stop_codon:yes gene_type:complete
MAAPNIVNVATITGKSVTGALGTSTATLLQNSSSSNKVFKINTILVSNVDGTNSATAAISLYDGTDRYIAKGITVPAGATVVLIDKNSSLYLEENKIIRGDASAAGDLEYIISYEELS